MELFARRNFVCDCGTTRLPETSPCTLRIDPATGIKGPVHSQKPAAENTYNQNFRNRFCGCGEWYDPHKQKGTMYQCIGLGTEQDGACGEDWWHPECLLGLPRDWHEKSDRNELNGEKPPEGQTNGVSNGESRDADMEHPVPPGFPDEDDFDTLICYKCVKANPWIKRYAGSQGFVKKVFGSSHSEEERIQVLEPEHAVRDGESLAAVMATQAEDSQIHQSRKRKAEDDASESESIGSKKAKMEEAASSAKPAHALLPEAPSGTFSLLTEDDDFRNRFCRCAECYPELAKHPQLLEEEETYEPPVSENGDAQPGSVGTGSLLERGEAALSNVDRVRAIGKYIYSQRVLTQLTVSV